ncbi:hypothetical protein HNP84_004786 [Thermocatellispora tengchongensis]|uniref:Uncharacterized protein n=1 Tax=Thermocatellispora tengchongensis TaxID=1073253 RepID=A0A840PC97_9ACTN|nr:hypothetical protein [Thermocatellispora tengchongensis]
MSGWGHTREEARPCDCDCDFAFDCPRCAVAVA